MSTHLQIDDGIDGIMQDFSAYSKICPLGKREQLEILFAGFEYTFNAFSLEILGKDLFGSLISVRQQN